MSTNTGLSDIPTVVRLGSLTRVAAWLRRYGPWLLLLAACWGWRETWLAQHHAAQVAEIRWQEQEMRVTILNDAVRLLAPDKWRARDAIWTAMRTWNRKGEPK